mmetsp:Transcript_3752/g.9572  ORF Transcript_3752/g.9572 Transcript_3752/m.9572 type:complete len:232 (-) Transcript_3752:140-835(-)|eukprot:CAMPEP_0181111632 /NCGR_PEP_ID=MMETSP1071-20121207/19375_1 /TAXON_ID=35127 /ORGANISM="Thalassiosira sp., Strain NH16" /LENGTH=231 /DNA_ID=CAMNT_0023195531 /DNA_START=119 /DNA_END=814 /DNA_ORIENTATION=+
MTSSTSDSMLADMMNYLSFLLNLIEAQDWTRFAEVALSNPNTFKMISKTVSACEELNGMTFLHACVRFDPPISILQQMINLYPQALRGEDCLGRTPLHVAAGCGASPYVMKILTINYPEACNMQDEDERTPLHFACDASCQMFEDDDSKPRCPPSLDVIRVLLSGSLDAVTLEDADEMNAVEYAIISDAPMEVVKLLQKATQRVMKQSAKNKSSRTVLPISPVAIARMSVQ